MTVEIATVLAFVVGAVILFATEKLPVDLVSIMVMAGLILSGTITAEEGISGFSHPATVTVGAMFVLSAGLYRTGAVNFVGVKLAQVGKKSFWRSLILLMATAGGFSAFINDTAVVAILLPVVLGLSEELKIGPGKFLIPLSFSALFGGVCTLIGTSTNILVSSIAVKYGQPPFGMFEFTPFGLVILVVGTLYMLLVGVRLLPAGGGDEDLRKLFGIGDYLVEIVLDPEAKSVGTLLAESPLLKDTQIRNVEVFRNDRRLDEPPERIELQPGDHLKVRCDLETFRKLRERPGITLRQERQAGEASGGEEKVLVEAVIAPDSTLDGRSLKQARFRSRYGLTALAVRHRGLVMREHLEEMQLRAGDVLLFEMERHHLDQLREDKTFVLVSEVEYPTFRKRRMIFAVAIISFVVGSAALGLMPILVSAVIGCILMVLSRCLTLEEAYDAIQWRVIFLLAGVLALGKALEQSGAAHFLASTLVTAVGDLGPRVALSAFYLLTFILTELMSNNATAALLAPIAIATASSLGVDARPFLMAVAYAASASFMTPVGYQTNTLIYSLGHYRYADFLRVGTPLNLIFWLLATLLIPWFWPF
ncbi:SLC13 family permease [Geobacter sp.]|uniref:SLC13 family permease n=1 Tax=Geobacter sp. TaxID=46610 RepID=UPI002632319E|nr:SLC13 family permease [Geobacter sp.]